MHAQLRARTHCEIWIPLDAPEYAEMSTKFAIVKIASAPLKWKTPLGVLRRWCEAAPQGEPDFNAMKDLSINKPTCAFVIFQIIIHTHTHVYICILDGETTFADFFSAKLEAHQMVTIASRCSRACAVIGYDRSRDDNIRNTRCHDWGGQTLDVSNWP